MLLLTSLLYRKCCIVYFSIQIGSIHEGYDVDVVSDKLFHLTEQVVGWEPSFVNVHKDISYHVTCKIQNTTGE